MTHSLKSDMRRAAARARRTLLNRLPPRVAEPLNQWRARRRLASLRLNMPSVDHLLQMSGAELHSLLWAAQEAVEIDDQMIRSLGLPSLTGGVNEGDQKALRALIHALKPRAVLEVGTHIGCSTVNIAVSLKRQPVERSLTSVDNRDVNAIDATLWRDAGAMRSARDSVATVGCASLVQFLVTDSLEFLRTSPQRFNFIFLDGSHDAHRVYEEVVTSCYRLNHGGVILLHDYFPGGQALWPQEAPLQGPYLAMKRLSSELPIEVLPLGELPWPTKWGTKLSSLALVVRKKRAA